jgi:Ca2+-binding RTX toxin-like protein
MTDAQVDGFSSIISAASNATTGDIITLSDVMTSDMLDGTVLGASAADELVIKLADVASNALTVHTNTFDTAADTLYIDGTALTGVNALTFNGAAETTAAVFKVTGGAAADTITGGDGTDTITGGLGADQLSGDGAADTFVFSDGDSGAYNTASAKVASTVTFDIILDVEATDVIDLTAALETAADYDTFTTASAAADLTATVSTNTIAQFIGSYDGSANTFTSDNSGDDILLGFINAAADTTIDECIVLVSASGSFNVLANSEITDGVITIA